MGTELNKIERCLVDVNIISSAFAIILSIAPTLFFYFFALIFFQKINTIGTFMILAPIVFFAMWSSVIRFCVKAKEENEIGLKKIILFVINLILTIPLLLFYMFCLSKIFLHI